MAKAHAYMEGRDYAVPEDVAAIFADVSGHRVILSPKAKMTETSASSVIESVLASVPMPGGGPRGVRGMWKARLTYGLWLVGAALLYVFTDRYYALVLLLASVAGPMVCVFVQSLPPDGPAVSPHLAPPRPGGRRPREC